MDLIARAKRIRGNRATHPINTNSHFEEKLMKRLASLLLLCALPFIASAAPVVGSGVAKTEARPVSGFHRIALGISANLELRQGTSEGLTITGDDNVLPLVETKVTNGVLEIRWAERNVQVRFEKLDIVVDAKNVDGLTIGGSGSIHAASLSTRALNATIGGSGSIALDKLDTDALKATIGGSGQLSVAGGRADKLDASLAGSGKLASANLTSRDALLALHGSPQATVRVRDALTVTVAGSGSVAYYGKPRITQSVMGSGSVRNAGD
jgi:Putative auto-transporter adhesin, head GIN domain